MKNRAEVALTIEERITLVKFTTTGNHSVRLVNRAKVILALDTSENRKAETQESISARVGVSRQTIENIKEDFFAAENITSFLQRKKRETPPVEPKITGEVEAHVIALACSAPPEGAARWTVRLLADKCVELNYVDDLSHMSVQRLLKKRNLSLI